MKALVIQQPWIHQIEIGVKTVEVRTLRTTYRGPVVLCAAQAASRHPEAKKYKAGPEHGVTVCSANLVDVKRGGQLWDKRALVASFGQWVWLLEDVQPLPRIPVRGQLGLFALPRETREALELAQSQEPPKAQIIDLFEALKQSLDACKETNQ